MLGKSFIIGFISVLSKLFLIVVPYILSPDSFNYFNKNYYALSLVIIISGFGFEFAYQRNPLTFVKLILLLLSNAIISVAFLYVSGIIRVDLLNLFLIIPAAVISNIINISSFSLLFNNNIKRYSRFLIIYFLCLILIYIIFIFLDFNPFLSYIFALFLSLLFVSGFILKTLNIADSNSIRKMYSLGLNALIINGFYAVVVSINHLLAGNFLSVANANNIILVWMIFVPLLYMSNIFEKVIYNSNALKNKIFNWNLITISAMLFYIILVFVFILFLPAFHPASAVQDLLLKYAVLISPVIFITAIMNASANAYTFKYMDSRRQTKIAISYSVVFLLFAFFSILILNSFFIIYDITLIYITGISLISAISFKSFFAFLDYKKHFRIEKGI